jgi:polyisoprenyl-phosphate glycosyltransferase
VKSISIIAPLHNEQESIESLIERLILTLRKMKLTYEIILVDDGSSDSTWSKLVQLSEITENLKCVRLSKNFGQHNAITAGLSMCNSEWTVVMDGDLQDRPEEIPNLYSKALEGFEIVFVSRKNRNESKFYLFAQKIFYKLLRKLSDIQFDAGTANFSIINKKVVEAYNFIEDHNRFYGSTIKWLGFKSTLIEADQGQRFAGETSYTLSSRWDLALATILNYSEKPLKIAIKIGIFVSTASLAFGLFFAYRKIFFGEGILGWPSLIVSIYFLAGVILIFMGILGIYIGQILKEVKKRPSYLIDQILLSKN